LWRFPVFRISIAGCILLLSVLERVETGVTRGNFEHYKNH
jgi:hypothetical protein